ncbi:hypothetical protein EBQ26_05955 [Allofranklinella schreckenbergeri]|uniref:Uncharacterized protein n=1 Tax=Allofranklinella schreckenbergeri TaxID=1076744 RepID=A0A3M6Q6P6_9BURK|nr:hypothetical protein [Allofranklinella schreckenbergeri]RMW98852.1 hypothetical protein EBQ26_05955 [Allofranklinella schreckenbergeri]
MSRRRFLATAAAWPLAWAAGRASLAVEAQAPATSANPSAATPASAAAKASLHAPTRYAFVADRFSYAISVVEIDTGRHVDTLSFGFRPRVFEMARDDAMLAVGSPEVPAICLHNLQTRQTHRLALPSPLYQIFFVPQTHLLAIGMRDQVGLIDYERLSLTVLARRFDSPRRETALNTYYSLLFSSFSQTFWVLDELRPSLWRQPGPASAAASGASGAFSWRENWQHSWQEAWQEIDLAAHVPGGSGLGIGVASAEDALLALTVDDGSQGLLYFPRTGRVCSTGPMRRSGHTNEPLLMPYIDAASAHVLFGDVQGHMALFGLDDEAARSGQREVRPERFVLDFSPRVIRSGWLDSTWIIGGDRALQLQSFADPADRKQFRFREAVTGIWVTGDSKTALVTLDEGPSRLYRYDIRTREPLAPIFVPHVAMPGLVRMGSNNSICY